MAKKRDEMVDGLIADEAEGWLANLLAEEEPYDRKMLWQLGSWAAAALGALAFAFLTAQSSSVLRSDLAAANELVRQNQQIAQAATERETEARRLVAAIDTLNADRDRLYARVTGLEQNLDSVTSSIKQTRTLVAPAPLPTAPAIGAPPESAAPQPLPTVSSLPAIPSAPPADADRSKDASKDSGKSAGEPVVRSDRDTSASKTSPVTSAKQPAAEASKPETKVDAAKAEPAKSEAAKTEAAKIGPAKPEPAKADTAKPEPAKLEPAKPVEAEKSADAKPADAVKADAQQATAATEQTAVAPPIVTAAIPPVATNDADTMPEVPVAKTEFGVDLGTASSIEGLRALWRAVQSSNKKLMAPLRPVIAIKERSGLGMQLRLVAGPLTDAAAAARICAALSENDRPCETAFFDGQRLAPASEFPVAKPAPPPRKKQTRANRRVGTPVAARPPARSGFSFLGGN